MLREQQARYEALLRVRDYGTEHEAVFPVASAAGQAFAAVGEAVAAIEHQSAERLVRAQAGKKARAAARREVWRRLTAIARTARRIGRSEPHARDVFRLPLRRSDVALLNAARAFVRDGDAVGARWVPLGLPETAIADLRQAVEAYDAAVQQRRQGRMGLADARDALVHAFDRGFDAVRDLDVIVANTVEPDSALALAWKRARRVGPATQADSTEREPVSASPGATAVVPSSPPPAGATEAAPGPGSSARVVTIGDELRRAS